MLFRLFIISLLYLPAAAVAAADAGSFAITILPFSAGDATVEAVTSGRLDREFTNFDFKATRERGGSFWLRLEPKAGADAPADVALAVRKGRHFDLRAYDSGTRAGQPLTLAATLPEYRAEQTALYALPAWRPSGDAIYVHVDASGIGAERLDFSLPSLADTIARGRAQTRAVAAAFGALLAMSVTALLICIIMPARIFVWYAMLFSLQALYIVYISGQGFDWPILDVATPLASHAWNVPAALSGAAACLFVRRITDMRRFYPRHYVVFGWLAAAFVVLAFSNFVRGPATNPLITATGNLIFLGAALYTLVIAFFAWLRGSRPAGWFLVAWGLLEVMTIWTAAKSIAGVAESLLFYGLPISMVLAAILVALGVADRLREQRVALSEAERRAQTDPLTGVLNRRSMIERLHAACDRAKARGLPIALLFIDLDHFKAINDTRGHLAGDACLRALIGPIQKELRMSDVIGRYGGEEFVVILSSADARVAQGIAQRIRERVETLEVEGFGDPIRLTCSIGVATSDALGVWGEELVARADAAVYVAKNAGRNQVFVAVPAAA
ncbi:MAG TPA: diguanylate cyclase [Steroidobacteraceae bacterium]|nr:diguanylate cyclase [Steroidobacteraceae bacterium]